MPLNTESLVSRNNDSLTHSNPGYLFCQPANKTMSVGGLGIIDVRLFSPFLHAYVRTFAYSKRVRKIWVGLKGGNKKEIPGEKVFLCKKNLV